MSATPRDGTSDAPDAPGLRPAPRTDASPLNWLLLLPVVLALAVPLYDQEDPTLFGIPFFYWFQLAIIPVGVACTTIVYRAGRRGSPARTTAGTPSDGPDARRAER